MSIIDSYSHALQILYSEASQEHRSHGICDQRVRRQCTRPKKTFVLSTDAAQVQGEAQGSDDAIKQFVQHLNKGPSASSVSGVEQSDVSTKSGESDFRVQ